MSTQCTFSGGAIRRPHLRRGAFAFMAVVTRASVGPLVPMVRRDGRSTWPSADGRSSFSIGRGVGRSAGTSTLLQSTSDHILAAVVALVREVGPTLLIGHSFGAPVAAKVADLAPNLVTGLISLAPAPHGNIADNLPVPEDRPIIVDENAMRRTFCCAPRFPKDSIERYRRSLCAMSPRVFNAVASGGSRALVIDDFALIASIPKLVVGADHDPIVTEPRSSRVAESLGARHVLVGKDWGLDGFGHMIPVESGSEEILKRCLVRFADATSAAG
jgi:pimeloyl-ACP methyl ester carboxylesterase